MTTLFVGNLASATTDDDLKELFGRFGGVESAGVVIDRNTNRSRGFAYVEMSTGAAEAMTGVNGLAVNGRPLSVSVATPRARPPVRAAAPVV